MSKLGKYYIEYCGQDRNTIGSIGKCVGYSTKGDICLEFDEDSRPRFNNGWVYFNPGEKLYKSENHIIDPAIDYTKWHRWTNEEYVDRVSTTMETE